MKSLSFKVGIILFSISLFIHGRYLETFGEERLYFCENPFAHCHFDQQDIVHTSKNIIGVWDNTVCKEKFAIEMAWKFGLGKRFSTSECPKMILLIFTAFWGIAIFLVLATVFYRIVVEPLVGRIKPERNKNGSED